MANQTLCGIFYGILFLMGSSTLIAQPQNYPGSGIYQPQRNLPLQTEEPLSPTERQINAILDFWFGNLPNPSYFPGNRVALWEGSPQTDQMMKEKFGAEYQRAAMGQYDAWRNTPEGRLALILLLDQFPRHFFPNQPQMFGTDAMAKGLALEGIQNEDDLDLYPVEKIFFYMPIQHSEDPRMQEYSVKLFNDLVTDSPPSLKPVMEEFLKLAMTHQAVIRQFGRFPHRNAVLGRNSTPAELEYLNQKSALRS